MRTCSSRIIIGISLDTFAVLCMLEETDILLLRLLNGENWSFAVAPGQRLSMTRLVFYGSVSFELDLVSKKIAADLPRAYHWWPESSDKVASSQRLSQSSYHEQKRSQLFHRNRVPKLHDQRTEAEFFVCLPPTLQWTHLLYEVIPDLFIGDLVLSLHDGLDLHQLGCDCTLLIELAAQERIQRWYGVLDILRELW